MKKLIVPMAIMAVAVLGALHATGGQSATHDVTMTYVNGKVVVTPSATKAAVGDVVRITSNYGEFSLKFTNALTDDGPTVHSTNRVYQFTVQGSGHFDCSMTVDGKVVASDYGGEIEPATGT